MDVNKDPITVFTHDDLDGGGVATLAEKAFGDNNLHELHCLNYHNIDGAVVDFIRWNYRGPHILVIADICPSRDVVDRLRKHMQESDQVLIILDHHKTTTWLCEYDDPNLVNDESRCGTLLFHDWLKGHGCVLDDDARLFAQAVDAYDRWLLKSDFRERAEKLNRLWWFLGKDMFIEAFCKSWNAENWTEHQYIERCLLAQEERVISKVVREQLDELTDNNTFVDRGGRTYLFLPSGKYTSQIGNALLEADEGIEYVVMLNATYGSLSFRARKGGVDVSEIAKRFGGGGHQAAAGCELPVMETLKVFITGLL